MGKGTSINYPAQQPYGESMREALQAQVDLAPALYEAEADPEFGRPAYAQLESQLMEDTILGARKLPEGTKEITSKNQRYELYIDSYPHLKKAMSADLKKPDETRTKWEWGRDHWKTFGKKEGKAFPSEVGTFYNVKKQKKVSQHELDNQPREGGMADLMGSTKEMADGRKPGFSLDGEFQGMTQLGEDLRKQAASAQREGDVADVEKNLDAYREVMKDARPDTITQLNSAVTAMDAESKRLTGDTITSPGSLQAVAKTLQKGDFERMVTAQAQTDRGRLKSLTAGDREAGAGVQKGVRLPPRDELEHRRRSRADQMALGERGEAGQLLGEQRGPLDQMSVLERSRGDQMGGYADLEDPFGLRQTMQQQAAEDLDAGGGLTARQRRDAEQAARRWGQASGRALDPLAAVREVEEVMQAQGAEQARRRAFAGQVLGQEAGIQTGELGRGMQQAGFNVQQEVARQEANLGRQLTAEEFNALQEAQRQRENVTTGMGAQQFNIQQQVAQQEANLGRRLTEQEFNTLQETSREEANIGRRMGAEQFNIQQEVARQEANLGRRLSSQEFNALQDAARQEANIGRASEARRYNIGMEEQRTEADIARDLQMQQYNIGMGEQRREGDIGRELGAAGADITQQMQQEQMNEQLKQRRLQGYLGGVGQVAGLEQQAYGDPLQAIIGRPAGTTGFGMGQQMYGGAGTALSAGPGVAFNPEAGLSYMLGQQANEAQFASAQAGAAARKGAGVMGMLGSLGGEAIGKWCWIAREVYGEDNPKWKQFRSWVLNKAPDWFREWYGANGPAVAEWLRDKPELKARIKTFMDSKLEA